jgi:hypothetical protein
MSARFEFANSCGTSAVRFSNPQTVQATNILFPVTDGTEKDCEPTQEKSNEKYRLLTCGRAAHPFVNIR